MNIKISLIEKKDKKNVVTYKNWKIDSDDNERIIYFLNSLSNKFPQKGYIIEIHIKDGNNDSTTWCYTIREFWYWLSGFEGYHNLVKNNKEE